MIKHLKYPLIIAHRGFKARYPENTLASFQGAVDAGFQMIELDVTLTKDRQVVVIHDDTVDRTTNGHGLVQSFTLKEIKNLDAGTWFNPKFSKERIPTLNEVMDLVGKQAAINIEIKASAYEKHSPDDAVENQVLKMVYEKNMLDFVMISSFEPKILQNIVKMKYPGVLSFLSETLANKDTIDFCKNLNIFSWNPHISLINQKQIDIIHDSGLKIFPYTINDKQEMEKFFKMGVDGIFTDYISP